jgi:hypothetical protein
MRGVGCSFVCLFVRSFCFVFFFLIGCCRCRIDDDARTGVIPPVPVVLLWFRLNITATVRMTRIRGVTMRIHHHDALLMMPLPDAAAADGSGSIPKY